MIGSTISHYKILERLGEGGMGEVFLSEDVRLHRPVALKFLRRCEVCEDDERARVFREARAASSLNHPNIAVIYDVEETEGPDGPLFLLAMEYVPGQPLAKLAEEATLTIDDILHIVEQTASALAEAHARGVVHRDIKPSNIMVAQGRVKVLDFGLASLDPRIPADAATWSRDLAATREGEVMGTPHYMSPEQTMGSAVDGRSDIFSLGVVFYELLAGCRPFEGENLVRVMDAVLHGEPAPLPPRFADPRMPEVARLVAHMLEKDPAARVSDAREVAVRIGRLRAGEPPAAVPEAGALSVAVAGFANITGRAEDDWLGTGLSETVTAALDEVEGVEVWGRERLRESLRRLGAEATELTPEDAVELGRMTGARWVLAGAFQRQGESVRVTVRVVDVQSGSVARAVKRDGTLSAIFELQDRIVADVTAGLRGTVAAAHEGEETTVVAAYEAMSKGLLNLRADNYESLDRAILFLERAVALDPGYVRAQIELGAALAQKGDYLVARELHEGAVALLRGVLDAQPRLPRVWRELGKALVSLGRVDEGIEHLRRAQALAPEDPVVLAGLARGLFIGKAEFADAAELFERAVERNPQAGWYLLQLAHCYALLRDFERGERVARRAIELQEAFISGQQGVQLVGAYMRLGHLFALQERSNDACNAFASELAFIERVDHALRSRIRIELHMRMGGAWIVCGNPERAAAEFTTGLEAFDARITLGADEPFTRYYAAATHALRGERDDALTLLESAAAELPAFTIARARIEPEWEGLRDDRRFQRLVRTPSA